MHGQPRLIGAPVRAASRVLRFLWLYSSSAVQPCHKIEASSLGDLASLASLHTEAPGANPRAVGVRIRKRRWQLSKAWVAARAEIPIREEARPRCFSSIDGAQWRSVEGRC
jgi:hypothetical protein